MRSRVATLCGEPVRVLRILHGDQTASFRDLSEQRAYLANPLAFWLRPDRDEHPLPCWEIDVPYRPVEVHYDVITRATYVFETVS